MQDSITPATRRPYELRRQLPIDRTELSQLIDAMDDQAESFLVSCVHFAKFMQSDIEVGTAYDVLLAMTQETYARLEYYRSRVDPISGVVKPSAEPLPPSSDTRSAFRR